MSTVSLSDLLVSARAGYWGANPGEGEETVLVVRNGDVKPAGGVLWDALPSRAFRRPEVAKSRIHEGDLLLTTSGDCGVVARVDREPTEVTCASNFIRVLRPDTSRVDPSYLFHFSQTQLFRSALSPFIRGTTLKNLATKDALRSVQVWLPALSEQQRISGMLDKMALIRSRRRRAMGLLDYCATSLFLKHFGDPGDPATPWQKAPLVDLCTGAGEYGAGVPGVNYDPKLPRYVRITDISDAGALLDNARSPGGPPSGWSRYGLSDGDLLFARSGATVGKTYLYQPSDGPCVYAGYLIRFRLDRSLADPRFVSAFTRTKHYKKWVAQRQNVVAQPNINAKQYGNELEVPVPALHLQRRFGDQLDRVKGEWSRMKSAQVVEGRLLDSIQARAFLGKL